MKHDILKLQWALSDFEVNFLRLLEKVTNGSTIEINYTGWSPSLSKCSIFPHR